MKEWEPQFGIALDRHLEPDERSEDYDDEEPDWDRIYEERVEQEVEEGRE